ncbi:MAG TPA: 7-cyano-7-deazaguanine synthase [Tepidisphaeraceae bacterium]|nr:7-cyano-7-deazaguanine synthase [Tepidisphaeraceae bacterium]
MAKDLAIILNNGSVNSAVTTAMAVQRFRPVLLCVEATQQAGSRLRAAYDMQVAHFKPYREHTLPMPYLSALRPAGISTGSLNDPRAPAALGGQMIELLPMLAAAVQFAVHYEAQAIYVGWRIGPQPDDLAKATEYIQIQNELIQGPCEQKELEIITPLLELEIWQVIDTGFQVAAPFERTWSCMEDTGEPCWACRGCRAREAAFTQAGKSDPLRVIRKV